MRQRRPRTAHIGFVIAVLLSGCSSSTDIPQFIYTPPGPPTRAALILGVSNAAHDEKVSPPFEISDLRKVEYGGFGSYFVCMREVNPTSERHFVYSVFYNNDEYRGVRQSVILERCEAQAFAPVETPPPKPPAPPETPQPRR
jgi:hypothetical protein